MTAPRPLPARAILFDLDGTLVDSAPDLGAAVNRMRVARGLEPIAHALLRPHASAGARGMLGAGFALTPEHADFPQLRAEFLEQYEAALCVETVLFPDVATMLDAVEAAGLQWGIVTNKATRYTLPLLDALNLRERPDCIICGDTAARAKPHPDPLFAAADRLGVAAGDCVYVGDAERDIAAGVAAGMPTLVALYGYIRVDERPDDWPATGHLANPLDLLDWLPQRPPQRGGQFIPV